MVDETKEYCRKWKKDFWKRRVSIDFGRVILVYFMIIIIGTVSGYFLIANGKYVIGQTICIVLVLGSAFFALFVLAPYASKVAGEIDKKHPKV